MTGLNPHRARRPVDVPLPEPDAMPELPGFFTHYGIRVCAAGPEGEVVVLGHHGNKRAVVAAINRHAVVDVGVDNFEDGWTPLPEDRDNLDETWAVKVVTGGGPHGYHVNWPVPAGDEGAFPVTVPRAVETG